MRRLCLSKENKEFCLNLVVQIETETRGRLSMNEQNNLVAWNFKPFAEESVQYIVRTLGGVTLDNIYGDRHRIQC